MKSIVVRAFILFTIFTLGIIIGGHYSKESVDNPQLYASHSSLVLDHAAADEVEQSSSGNVLSEMGKHLATFVTFMVQSFVKWIIQVIP